MTTKQQLTMLREIVTIYENCEERTILHARHARTTALIAWLFILFAFMLSSLNGVNNKIPILVALIGGLCLGMASTFKLSARQMPLLVRFTSLREIEIRKEILELQNSTEDES